MSKEIELERLEKTSTLVRNIILILGALITGAFFLTERFATDVTVHVKTLYLNGENTIISTPAISGNNSTVMTGRLGTISEVEITNNSKLPVSLEVRIPKLYDRDSKAKWPLFTTVSAEPQCHLKKKEISISNNGIISSGTVGSVEIAKFPPDCTLEVTVSSTQIDEVTRFMSGRIEVFYDGKKAEIDRPTRVYGLLGKYLYTVNEKGAVGILLFVLFPVVLILFSIVWLMETLPKNKKSEENDPTDA